MRTVEIGIIGLGTVGGGVARTVMAHRDQYRKSLGIDLHIKRACGLEPERASELGLEEGVFTSNWHEVVGDPAIDIVVELIGGDHPATEIFEDAIAGGKHVVSANKALLGRNMERLAELAHEAGVQIRCEAAVGGGIPIVSTLERDLSGNGVLAIAGIVNGTTNYILSRMESEGMDFTEALCDAQRLGYAEADPTADVDGFDAASKIAILSSIGFASRVTTDDVYMQGIRNITEKDIELARSMGFTIKLLAIARKVEGSVDVRVHPAMIPADHQLAGVSGAMNAVYVVGDAVGETMFYGAGAGSFPTASAVVGDVIELATPIAQGTVPLPEPEPYRRELPVRPIEQLKTRYLIRLACNGGNADGSIAQACSALERHTIGIDSLTRIDGGAQIAIVTKTAVEGDVRDAERELAGAGLAVANIIRIEDVAGWCEGVLEN